MNPPVALQAVASSREDRVEPSELSDPSDDLIQVVGKNLRRLRVQRGLSLERLAKISGVSRAMLSHIELGQSAPTITTLNKISKALEIPFTALLFRSEKKTAFVLRSEDSKILHASDGRTRFRSLFPYDVQGARHVEFYELKLDALSKHASSAHAPGTLENLVVQSGVLELRVGREIKRLKAGDAIYFAGDVPHTYVNPGDSETVLYLVMIYGEQS